MNSLDRSGIPKRSLHESLLGHSCDVTGLILKGQGVYGPRSHDETFGPIRCYRVEQGCQTQFQEGHLIRVESKLCRAVALQECCLTHLVQSIWKTIHFNLIINNIQLSVWKHYMHFSIFLIEYLNKYSKKVRTYVVYFFVKWPITV